MITRSVQRRLLTFASVAAMAVPIGAIANDASAQQRYHDERADCLSGHRIESRATCLYEARSALRDARHGTLVDVDSEILAANALLRCERVPYDVKSDCERLARGEGVREGSVAEGGVVMWLAEVERSAAIVPTGR